VHDHFQESDSGNSYIREVMGVGPPWFGVLNLFLFSGIIRIEGISVTVNKLDVIIELFWMELEYCFLKICKLYLPQVFRAVFMIAACPDNQVLCLLYSCGIL